LEETSDHVVPEPYLGDVRADGGHHPGDFMAKHGRHLISQPVVRDRQVRVTKPCCLDVHEHFTPDGFSDVNVLDHESFADAVDDCSPHVYFSWCER
jgi:hypothetical protein